MSNSRFAHGCTEPATAGSLGQNGRKGWAALARWRATASTAAVASNFASYGGSRSNELPYIEGPDHFEITVGWPFHCEGGPGQKEQSANTDKREPFVHLISLKLNDENGETQYSMDAPRSDLPSRADCKKPQNFE